jgi:hypothetical protein
LGTQRLSDEIAAVDDAERTHANRGVDGMFAGTTGTYRVVPDGAGCRLEILWEIRYRWSVSS